MFLRRISKNSNKKNKKIFRSLNDQCVMKPKIYLAPLSGITDLSFRLLSRKFGVEHCFYEMLDARALLYEHPRNGRLLKTTENDTPLSAQLLGKEPSIMLEAAEKLIALVKITSIDINSACPAKKILKKGAGAALLKNKTRLGNIIKKLSSNLRIPVTVKLRAGYDRIDVKECVKTAKLCQTNDASTIFMHGRTALQGYSSDVNYESIRAVKEALTVPVFGSGNILNPFMGKKMFDETGCDGILIARGALGIPWIFKNTETYLKNGSNTKTLNLSTKKKILKLHLAYIEKYKELGPAHKMGFMGKVAMHYVKGLPSARRIREWICSIRSYGELINIIDAVQ